MVEFTALLEKFGDQGEKTGWTYIKVPAKLAQQLKPNNKKAFRVKGFLDAYAIDKVSLIPMGEGDFIMAVNAGMRKGIGKSKGTKVKVKLEPNAEPFALNAELMDCLNDDPPALAYFKSLPPSHQRYYSNWIDSAKTDQTKTKRIAQAVTACSRKMHYGEMVRALKQERSELGL